MSTRTEFGNNFENFFDFDSERKTPNIEKKNKIAAGRYATNSKISSIDC